MKTRIGNVALVVAVGAVKDGKMGDVVAAAVKDAVYRGAANKLFPSGKDKKGFKRDDAWSEALGEAAVKAVTEVLSGLFDGVEVEASAYVAVEKAVAVSPEDMLALATGVMSVAEFAAKYPQKAAATAAKVEPASESSIGTTEAPVEESVE